MSKLPVVFKIIINIFFFFIYLIIWIFLVSFVYWFTLSNILWKVVPSSSDPIHMKIAWVVFLIVFIVTIVYRKYFYILLKEHSLEDDLWNTYFWKKEVVKENLPNCKKTEDSKKESEEMEIYIGKEMKN